MAQGREGPGGHDAAKVEAAVESLTGLMWSELTALYTGKDGDTVQHLHTVRALEKRGYIEKRVEGGNEYLRSVWRLTPFGEEIAKAIHWHEEGK